MGSVIHDHEHVHDMGTGATAGSAMMGVVRLIITIAGAAAMIFGAFLKWVNGHEGVHLALRAYYRPVFADSGFIMSAGAVMILLGLIALVGLAGWGGWLSRIAGALGVVAFVLILISMGRAAGLTLPDDIGVGLWWSLAGSIVVIIGGFLSVPWE
jgi:hypothetical protein